MSNLWACVPQLTRRTFAEPLVETMNDETLHPDLFGGETPIVTECRSPYVSFKVRNHYRSATDKRNCGNCKNGCLMEGNTKNYRKCKIQGITASQKTDVSKRKVCDLWEA